MLKRGETRTKAFKEVVKQMRALSSTQIEDPNFLRMKYLRYADDWIVGVGGSHALAEDLKVRIKTFLGERLETSSSNTSRRWGVQAGKQTCQPRRCFLH
jgi:hypothetical protein